MQDAIILYENGKAIGGEGHPTDADDITFDNTGTDIVANKVGSAIKEVNAKTKHGIVELWSNTNTSFAGQTVTITTDLPIDSLILEIGADGVLKYCEFGVQYQSRGFSMVNNAIQTTQRLYSATKSGNTISVVFGDGSFTRYPTYGGAGTTTSSSSQEVPYRILGLIHND